MIWWSSLISFLKMLSKFNYLLEHSSFSKKPKSKNSSINNSCEFSPSIDDFLKITAITIFKMKDANSFLWNKNYLFLWCLDVLSNKFAWNFREENKQKNFDFEKPKRWVSIEIISIVGQMIITVKQVETIHDKKIDELEFFPHL